MRHWVPRPIYWIFSLMFFFLICMSAYRIFFFEHFGSQSPSFDVLWMGLRYDARAVSILGLAMSLLIALPVLNPTSHALTGKGWTIVLTIVWLIFLFFYGADFYYHDYLKQRLSASVLQFLADANISAGMVWETYPVLRIMLLLIFMAGIFAFFHAQLLQKIKSFQPVTEKKKIIPAYILFVLLMAIAAFGRIGQYPLRWSDAFLFTDDFKASASLNPFQSFISTFQFRNDGFDEKLTSDGFSRMAEYLNIDPAQKNSLNYVRKYNYVRSDNQPPMNVVLVICESFHAPKCSAFGNSLDPTPYFKNLADQGVLYDRCFTPAFGTARGVWSVITGIPDVLTTQTSSRNPLLVDQHSIFNDFKDYEKFYFLGGSTSWANIQGVLKNNIDGLNIVEQDQFTSQRVDVWGISDKNLFLESNQILSKQTKPFFAIIQTADNHRPYTIPQEDIGAFQKKAHSAASLSANFFENNEQYNAFRYMDFSIKTFMDAARKSNYFSNTLFVFVGDHGLRGGVGSAYPKVYSEIGISAEHVPLLFYAPGKLIPKRKHQVCSQLDVLPSIAGFVKHSHTNSTLGRNLFDTNSLKSGQVFIADPDNGNHTLLNDSFYFTEFTRIGKYQFGSMLHDQKIPLDKRHDSIQHSLATQLRDWQSTARYLLFHNKKNK
jgi:phosphoglycerol transferase MdoB-like AlkP superfamily enzyme